MSTSGFKAWQTAVIAAEKLTAQQVYVQKLQKESQMSPNDRLITLRSLLREALAQKKARLVRTGSEKEISQAMREFAVLEAEMVQTFHSLDHRTAVETCQAIISSMRLWGNATAPKPQQRQPWGLSASDPCVVTFLLDEAEVCSWPMEPSVSEEFQVAERAYHAFQYDSSDCEKRQQRQRRLLQRIPRGSLFLENTPNTPRVAAKSP